MDTLGVLTSLVMYLVCVGSVVLPNALVVGPAVWYVMRQHKSVEMARIAANSVRRPGALSGGEVSAYARLAPTWDRLREWSQAVRVMPLGGELEAQFKALLDRALAEDFFHRFGDSFVVLMRVSCIQVVQPQKQAPQEIWNALIKRHVDFLVCDRWTLEPVMAYMIWLGEEGRAPQPGLRPEEDMYWSTQAKLSVREWEQWIAAGMLMAGGVPTMLIPQERVRHFLTMPEMLLDGLAPALEVFRERLAALERERA